MAFSFWGSDAEDRDNGLLRIASNVERCAHAGINMAHSVFGADGKVISIRHELTRSQQRVTDYESRQAQTLQ